MTAPRRSRVVVVAGATGCVGRHVARAFLDAQYQVFGLARRGAPHVADIKFRPLDVAAAEPGQLAELFDAEQADVVINAAGGWDRTEEAMRYAHVRLVENLVDAVGATRRRPRLVQVGSIHEYGEVPDGVDIDESVPPRPGTAYAQTKHAGSAAVLRAADTGRLDAVVLRSVNVCGPYTTSASFLGAVRDQLRTAHPDRPVEITVAPARRDFVDVRDLAAAVLAAATAPAAGRVVNIGRGEAVLIGDLLRLLVRAAGLPSGAVVQRSAEVDSKGGGWTRADIRVARELLGWEPQISLAESLRDMWRTGGGDR
ncbi:NAD(P)-dependent oxidoreductase [Micromonospora ureilytica]|uniref:NAD-dependent epimerase/dehydratase family protein n=1 Tax=Micromonospora ureilytica TaxID=709868 RepID=UPI0033D15B52